MSAGAMALLAGLFLVPAFLLWAGHHWRHTGPRMRGAFWGGLIAHTVAALAASAAGMYEPAEWAEDDRVRGFFGYWSMLVFFLIGAGAGALINSGSGQKLDGGPPRRPAGKTREAP